MPVPVLRACPPGTVGGQGPTAGGRADFLDPVRPGQAKQDALELDAVELQRAAALSPGAQAAFVAGRLAVRRFAAELLGLRASDLSTNFSCPRCGAGPALAHGRPGYTLRGAQLPLSLSLSRSSGWILLGALVDPPSGVDVGVDLEDPSRLDFAGFDAVALTRAEQVHIAGLAGRRLLQERARLWVRKEAWLKMTGEGLTLAPETLDVLSRPEIRDLAPGEAGLPPEFRAAVAVSHPVA